MKATTKVAATKRELSITEAAKLLDDCVAAMDNARKSLAAAQSAYDTACVTFDAAVAEQRERSSR